MGEPSDLSAEPFGRQPPGWDEQMDMIVPCSAAPGRKVEHQQGGKASLSREVVERKAADRLVGAVRRSTGSQNELQLHHHLPRQRRDAVEGSDHFGNRRNRTGRIPGKYEVAARIGQRARRLISGCRRKPCADELHQRGGWFGWVLPEVLHEAEPGEQRAVRRPVIVGEAADRAGSIFAFWSSGIVARRAETAWCLSGHWVEFQYDYQGRAGLMCCAEVQVRGPKRACSVPAGPEDADAWGEAHGRRCYRFGPFLSGRKLHAARRSGLGCAGACDVEVTANRHHHAFVVYVPVRHVGQRVTEQDATVRRD